MLDFGSVSFGRSALSLLRVDYPCMTPCVSAIHLRYSIIHYTSGDAVIRHAFGAFALGLRSLVEFETLCILAIAFAPLVIVIFLSQWHS